MTMNKLLLSFDNDSPEFTRGFECGHIWTKLRETDERTFTVHWANAEMMLRIAEALHLEVVAEQLDNGDTRIGDIWIDVTFAGEWFDAEA